MFSYSNVVATIAVFVALGGSSWAAVTRQAPRLQDDGVVTIVRV